MLNANGVTKARNYGRYLGTRYRSFDNIIWMSGNDFQSWPNPGDDAVVQAVARGIQDTDDRHIHTVELDYLVSGSLDDPTWAPLIELNASYTYYPTYAQVLADYNRPNALPTFMVEANYEFEHNAADLGTPQILRRQEYWTLLSGAAGQLYGNRYTWPFIERLAEQSRHAGLARRWRYVKFLFEPRPWYNLIPDQTHTVVTAGYGTFSDSGALGDNDYLTAARTPDGALVMAYMPTRPDDHRRHVEARRAGLRVLVRSGERHLHARSPARRSPTPARAPSRRRATTATATATGCWCSRRRRCRPTPSRRPSPPASSATAVAATQVTLSWTASHDNVGVAGYQIYRDGALVRTTPATSYTDTGLVAAHVVLLHGRRLRLRQQRVGASPRRSWSRPRRPAPSFVQQSYATPQTPQSAGQRDLRRARRRPATPTSSRSAGTTRRPAITSVTDSAGNVYQPAIATVPRQRPQPGDLLRRRTSPRRRRAQSGDA